MQALGDSALLRQYIENQSDEAFAALVTRHINLVYAVALRQVGDPHHAEEITQAVFIILAKRAMQLRHEKALSSWLFQATRLTVNNFVRSEARRHHREQEAYMQSVLNESGENIWPRIAPLLDTAVAALSEKDRRAIVLRFYEGRNLREVGVAMGAREEAVKKRIARALERLQRYFSKRGLDSTTRVISEMMSANCVHAAPAALSKTATAVALTKGATASTATVTLLKGALKIMAWTKAKTAVIAGAVILLTAGTTVVVVRFQLSKPRPVISGQTEFPKASWHFAGYGDPMSAFLSLEWAAAIGDIKTFTTSLNPAWEKQVRGKPDSEVMGEADLSTIARMKGFRFLDKQVLSEDEVLLEMEMETGPPRNYIQKFSMQKVNGEWKFGGPVGQERLVANH